MREDHIFQLWQNEQAFFKTTKEKNPELFVHAPHIESQDILERVGIQFPYGELPFGYLKFHPFDFIVEEIQNNGRISSIDYKDINFEEIPDESPTYFADLVKVGISSIDAVKELSKQLSIEEKFIGIAGIKDAHALTSQRISLRQITKSHLLNFKPSNIFLKELHADKGALQIGSLKGNRFTIFVRTEKPISQETIEDKLFKLKNTGFWNFYWLQRFGNRLISHALGLHLLHGNYEAVVHSYFCDHGPRDLPLYAQIRQQAHQFFGDWKKLHQIFSQLPYSLRYEIEMTQYLIHHPNDFIGVLRIIPDQIKLWAYAYASYVFNRYLSFCAAGKYEDPKKLPLLLTMNRDERQYYKAFLEADQVPNNFEKNLRPFPFIRLQSRKVPTQFSPQIIGVKSLDEGIATCFELDKGSYATTFLSHLFTLTGSQPLPSWLKTNLHDTKKLFGTGSIEETEKLLSSYAISAQHEE